MLKKAKIFTGLLVFLFVNLLLSTNTYGQDGDPKAVELLETLQERYEESIEGIDDFIIVMDNQTIYNKKAYDNRRPYFKTRTETEDMGEAESTSTVTDTDLFSKVPAVKEKASYEGTEEINGHEVHVIYVDKLEGLHDLPHTEYELEDLKLYIDTDKWVLRQMEYTAEFTTENGESRKVTPVIQHKDFRNVEGMMIAYETNSIIKGLELSEEERQEAREGIEEYEKKLEEMPEMQREMAERMMGDQIEEFKKMLEEDQFETVRVVEEVKVNTGMEDF